MGPEPTLLSRKEFDGLYETLEAVQSALKTLKVDAIVTGGSLLGAIRQHSILFCDDDIDLTMIDYDGTIYETVVKPNLQQVLGKDYLYQIRPWEGGDRIRPRRMSNIFVDLFVLCKYDTMDDLKKVIGMKKNGQSQSKAYVDGIIDKITTCTGDSLLSSSVPLCPFWHFSTRKAIEMWSKEVYRDYELFPMIRDLKMGPVTGICGPRMPVTLLKRAFGEDCFIVYFQSTSHQSPGVVVAANTSLEDKHHEEEEDESTPTPRGTLHPLVGAGGTWEGGIKMPLKDEHYIPNQPISKSKRRPSLHNRERLEEYLVEQSILENQWIQESCCTVKNSNSDVEIQKVTTPSNSRPRKTIYMDGVFDLFHIGHLEAIRKCGELGDRIIIGITGDIDATGYKRRPIVPEEERCAIIEALELVDEIVCPCPLVVTEFFMEMYGIDLVVHGFANDADAERQREFFEFPMKTGRFQRIPYYAEMSTTDRIEIIQNLPHETKQSEEIATQDDTIPTSKKPQWFGLTVTVATFPSYSIPYDPFPVTLRLAIEPHIEKARRRRQEALDAIRQATGTSIYDDLLAEFSGRLSQEANFHFDVNQHTLRESLLNDFNLALDFDLSRLHEYPGMKMRLSQSLTTQYGSFQEAFDSFVRGVCAPHMDSVYPCEEIYYQAFPCLRIVQPDEFSIGPHSDVAYGHHPCSVNFYVPLTQIDGSASLFLESRPGSEDWHPILGSYGTFVCSYALG